MNFFVGAFNAVKNATKDLVVATSNIISVKNAEKVSQDVVDTSHEILQTEKVKVDLQQPCEKLGEKLK